MKNVGLNLTWLCGEGEAQLYSVVGWWTLRCHLSFWVYWRYSVLSAKNCPEGPGEIFLTDRGLFVSKSGLWLSIVPLRDSTFSHQGSWEHMKNLSISLMIDWARNPAQSPFIRLPSTKILIPLLLRWFCQGTLWKLGVSKDMHLPNTMSEKAPNYLPLTVTHFYLCKFF